MQYNIMYRIMVVALCLLGFAGCSEEEEMPVKDELGKTVLRVALGPKDIITNNPTTEVEREKYVKTLHIIGIDQNNVQGINEEVDLSKAPIVEKGEDKYAEFTIEEIPAGVYTLYSVANAGSDLDWQSSLASATVSAYTSGTQPSLFLMSAINKGQAIDPNNSNNRVTIELIRTVAKIGIGTIKQGEDEVTDYSYTISVNGNVYQSYPLFEGTGSGTTAIDIDSNNAPVYLSESGSDLEVSLSVTIDGMTYTGVCDEDIIPKRNTFYQLNGTIDEQTQCLLLNISVANWEVLEEWEEQPLSPTYE